MLSRAALLLLFAPACAPTTSPDEPFFDPRIGVQGVATSPGDLAGTFALKTQSVHLAETPVGEVEGGGGTFQLVRRTWNDVARTYAGVHAMCAVFSFDAGGLSLTTPDAAARKLPEMQSELSVDHATGTYEIEGVEELWGLQDGALPLPEDALDPRVVDTDEDGRPGMTIFASGVLSGEIHYVQVRTTAFSGVVAAGGAVGLIRFSGASRTLAATNELLTGSAPSRPHRDEKESWFAEVQLPDDADCDDVVRARDDETLPRLRPF